MFAFWTYDFPQQMALKITIIEYLIVCWAGISLVNYLNGDTWFHSEYLIEETVQSNGKSIFHIISIFYFLWIKFDLGRLTERIEEFDYSGSQEISFWFKPEAQRYINNGFKYDHELNKTKTILHKTNE